jgi:threonine/homoserine/homoserine lactone efflux protein
MTYWPLALGVSIVGLLATRVVLLPDDVLLGLVVGFSVAAPIGPMGMLCMSRTLAHGRTAGVLTGLGEATVEGMCAGVAALGLGGVTQAMVGQRFWLAALGGAVLVALGLRTLLLRQPLSRATASHPQLASSYVTALALAATNPMSVLPYVALCAAWADQGREVGPLPALSLAVGAFGGALVWWVVLSCGIHLFRSKRLVPALPWVSRLSGLAIIGMGLSTLLHVVI